MKSTKSLHLVFSKGTELLRVPTDQLMYILADGNYSHVHTCDNREHLLSMQLGQISDCIFNQIEEGDSTFMRLGRSLIINTDYIYFIDISRQLLVLSDCKGSYHELSASKEVLTLLRNQILDNIK